MINTLLDTQAPLHGRTHLRSQDLNLLLVLRVLLETCHVSETARLLDSSQPVVSRMLERLRLAMADPLLIKSANKMVCTPRAEELKPLLSSLAGLLDEIYRVPADYRLDQIERTVVVGMNDALQYVLGPNLLNRFRSVAPRASLKLVPLAHTNPRQAVINGEVDLMIGMTSAEETLLRRQPVLTSGYLCLVSRDHPIGGEVLTVDSLADWPYLEASNTGIMTLVTDKMFARAGVRKRTQAHLSSFLAAPEVIAGTDLVCILPAYLFNHFSRHDAVRCLRVVSDVEPHSVSMYWHNSKHIDPFVKFVRELVFEVGRKATELVAPPAEFGG